MTVPSVAKTRFAPRMKKVNGGNAATTKGGSSYSGIKGVVFGKSYIPIIFSEHRHSL
jgi:hypothetical protein